jgi:hypothetical protein
VDFLLRIFRIDPYRCGRCGRRFYRRRTVQPQQERIGSERPEADPADS